MATDPGLVLVDKPVGWTSRKAGAIVSKGLGVRKLGHLGTLDPFATGLLPLCLGRGTRLSAFLDQDSKVYEAILQLGQATDSLDCEGEPTESADVPPFDQADLDRVASTFIGEVQQIPPAFSAVRVGGQRAYKRARRGEAVEMPSRTVRIDSLTLRAEAADRLALCIQCGPGTYVRTVGADVAKALGTVGHLTALRRTGVGPLSVDEASHPEALAAGSVWSVADLLRRLGEPIVMDAANARWVRDGKPLEKLEQLSGCDDGRYAIFDVESPVALIERQRGLWKILRGLPPA